MGKEKERERERGRGMREGQKEGQRKKCYVSTCIMDLCVLSTFVQKMQYIIYFSHTEHSYNFVLFFLSSLNTYSSLLKV